MSIKNFKRIIYLLLVSVILVGVFNLSSKNSQLQAGAIYDKNNIISDDNSLSTIINGNIKYFIKSIDAYDIVKPNNIKSIDNFQDIFTSSTMDIDEYNGPLLTPDDPGFYDNHTIDKIDSDSDGLSDMLESIYGTDINNPDTDGDGYTDGEEVDNGYNPLGEGLISLPPPSYDDWGMNDISNVDLNLDTEPLRSEQVCYFTGGQWLSDSYTSEFYCLCPGDIKKGPLDAYSFLGCD